MLRDLFEAEGRKIADAKKDLDVFCTQIEAEKPVYLKPNVEQSLYRFADANEVLSLPHSGMLQDRPERYDYAVVARVLLCAMKSMVLDEHKSTLDGFAGCFSSFDDHFFRFDSMHEYIESSVAMVGNFAEIYPHWDQAQRNALYIRYIDESEVAAIEAEQKMHKQKIIDLGKKKVAFFAQKAIFELPVE